MKTIFYFAVISLALVPLTLGAPAFGQPAQKRVCLYAHEIRNSQPSKDEKSITFVMNNGDRWRNDLLGHCNGIKYDGFTWVLHGDDQVCDNSQTLTVNINHTICMLGKFTQLPKPEPKVN